MLLLPLLGVHTDASDREDAGNDMAELLKEIQRRQRMLYRALQAGEDIPPGQLLRLEGMMEAAAISGLAEPAQLQARMAVAYREVFGRSLEQDRGEDWAQFYPFPQIPAAMKRAPVYPSTPMR